MPAAIATPADLRDASVDRILELARAHLGMDVAFVGKLTPEGRMFRNVAGPAQQLVGVTEPLAETHCALVADGTLSEIVSDTENHDLMRDHIATVRTGVRAFAGVPLVFANGTVFGTLCTVSQSPQPTLRDRDLAVLRLLADLVTERLEDEEFATFEQRALQACVTEIVAGDDPTMVFQPIIDLGTGKAAGFEALARFRAQPAQAPDHWFDAANRAGLGVELEAKAVHRALTQIHAIPERCYLSLNLSERALCSDIVADVLAGVPSGRLVIELTEHEVFDDRAALAEAMARYRSAGARFAMDDVGSGYAGLQRVLRLAPEIVKLDRSLITDLDVDPARQALVAGTVVFAQLVGATLVAEGIERQAEADMAASLGVSSAQGFLFGKPSSAPWQAAGRSHHRYAASPRTATKPLRDQLVRR